MSAVPRPGGGPAPDAAPPGGPGGSVDRAPSGRSVAAGSVASSASEGAAPRGPTGAGPDDEEAIFKHGRARRRAYKDVGRELGVGVEAHVRAVRCVATNGIFALKKVMKPMGPELPDILRAARARWDRIAPVAASHPSMPRFVEGFESADAFYAVMEVLPDSLDSFLARRGGRLDEGEAAEAMRPLLSALAHLHAHGIIHRDVKPANLLFREHGRPGTLCLADLASVFCSPHPSLPALVPRGHRQAFPAVGTPYYLSPEAAAGGPYDCKTDLWAAGVVLCEMLRGRTPFEDSASMAELFARVVAADVDMPAAGEMPEGARDLLARLLSRHPEGRPSAAEALGHPWLGPARATSPDGADAPPTPASLPWEPPTDLAEAPWWAAQAVPKGGPFRTTLAQSGIRVVWDPGEGVLRVAEGGFP
ncbi:kinase-like domain-containing protein [Hyaloraphidium curvatum]|nr:kinase-like domain-containing protein [Hyaloraphidium curvatum]KAI9014018.1 kinase-like domain-containing protein [Hyaloraphidium curvatum]